MENTNLFFIPHEIIEHILGCEILTYIDVCNFGSTCTQFWQLVSKGNQLWKIKFSQKYPHLMRHEEYKHYPVTDWQHEFRQRLLISREAMQVVGTMSARHIKHEELSPSDFNKFKEVIDEAKHKFSFYFVMDELRQCILDKNRDINLTNKYYSEKALRFLRQIDVAQKWEVFKNLPPDEQLLEHGAVLIAQWSQPTEEITNTDIGSQLNAIAEKVRQLILSEFGEKHPALSVPSETRTHWQRHNLTDNYYTPYVSRQVLSAVSTVLFKEMGFYGNNDMYYSHENSYINKVLELRRGIPITLAILYESVTRRLGIKCEPVSFPGHFLLRWRDSYKEGVVPDQCYIDVFNGGLFLNKDSCPKFSNTEGRCPMGDILRHGPASAIQVMERMANNLEVAGRQRSCMNGRAARLRSALELIQLVNPTNLNIWLQLARFYMQYNMDVSALRETIETGRNVDLRNMAQASYILRNLRDYDDNFCQHLRDTVEELEVKKRTRVEVQFAVGMVMRHRQFNYTCVVIGWDPECVASEEWINQMNVKSLSRKSRQPFYHVLVSDGTNRYAAEENLKLERLAERDCWVTHCEVGRYFDTFCQTHYLLNSEMLRAYPDDPPLVLKLLGLQ